MAVKPLLNRGELGENGLVETRRKVTSEIERGAIIRRRKKVSLALADCSVFQVLSLDHIKAHPRHDLFGDICQGFAVDVVILDAICV